ncbi:MAG: hypothetical protein ACSHYF_05635 [Verrucomicrobiaceae bacterium]
MRASVKLFSIIPGVLRLAWALLLAGTVLLASGYFMYSPWQSYVGLGCVIFGYLIAIFDMFCRKRHRGEASAFYAGAITAPLIASFLILFIALLGALVLAVKSMISGYSAAHAIRLLHFLGIIFAFLVVSGIPGLALRARQKVKNGTGQGGDSKA